MKVTKVDETKLKSVYDLAITVPEDTTIDKSFNFAARRAFPVAWIEGTTLHIRIKVPKNTEMPK